MFQERPNSTSGGSYYWWLLYWPLMSAFSGVRSYGYCRAFKIKNRFYAGYSELCGSFFWLFFSWYLRRPFFYRRMPMSQDNASFTFLHRIEEVELNIEDGRWAWGSSWEVLHKWTTWMFVCLLTWATMLSIPMKVRHTHFRSKALPSALKEE